MAVKANVYKNTHSGNGKKSKSATSTYIPKDKMKPTGITSVSPLTKSAGKLTKTPQIVPKSGSGTIKSKRLTTTPVYETPGFKPGTRNLKKK